MSAQLFNAALTGAFAPSKALLIAADTVTLSFLLVTTGGPSTVQYFMEFTDGDPLVPATQWDREVAEEDSGEGVVLMPKVIRTFADNAGANLADGTHALSCQFNRRAPFVRVQMRVTAGACTATVKAPIGTVAGS